MTQLCGVNKAAEIHPLFCKDPTCDYFRVSAPKPIIEIQ